MKNAYFPHDCNATADPKMIMLFNELGLEGIGFYWILAEVLNSQTNGTITEIEFENYVKYYFRTNDEQMFNKIQQVFNTTNLLIFENGNITSKRVLENLNYVNSIREKRSKAGKKSAEIKKKLTSVEQVLNKCLTNVEQMPTNKTKLNEIKLNEIKLNDNKENIKDIISYLNLKTNKKYTTENEGNNILILARLKKHSVEDLKKVIDYKCGQWLNDKKMCEYLCPPTLFSKTKFKSYLEEANMKIDKFSKYDIIDNPVESNKKPLDPFSKYDNL